MRIAAGRLSHLSITNLSSVQFSCSVMSDSLRPHELQHARPPCPSPAPGVYSNSRSYRFGDTIQPSHPLLPRSPPAPSPSQDQGPLSKGFSRQEYWSELPCFPPGDLPDPGIEPVCLPSPALADGFFIISVNWKLTNAYL